MADHIWCLIVARKCLTGGHEPVKSLPRLTEALLHLINPRKPHNSKKPGNSRITRFYAEDNSITRYFVLNPQKRRVKIYKVE